MRQIRVKLFSFDELSKEAQTRALDKFRDLNTDGEWWEWSYEEAKKIAALMGIEIEDIHFSGFSSQGDGACFVGSFEGKRGAFHAVRSFAPKDKTLHEIARRVEDVQQKYGYALRGRVVNIDSHYSHENTVRVEVDDGSDQRGPDVAQKDEDELQDAFRAFMRWIYKTLEAEYEYQTADEQVAESIKANEYEFRADGSYWR